MSKNSKAIFDYNSDDVRSGAVDHSEVSSHSGKDAPRRRKLGCFWYAVIIIGISAVLSVFLISTGIKRINDALIMELTVGEITLTQEDEGQFQGSFSSGRMGASVTVHVTAGYIMDISLNGFNGIDTSRVGPVFDCVIAAQSLDTGYDEIGSQPTDKILLLAIRDALEGGQDQ